MKRIIMATVVLLASGNAAALEAIAGKVTRIDVTSMPNKVSFTLSAGNPTCPAGGWVSWQGTADSNKAIYAALMTAITNDNSVVFYINSGETTCRGAFLHLLP
jgi:hypothetical protein